MSTKPLNVSNSSKNEVHPSLKLVYPILFFQAYLWEWFWLCTLVVCALGFRACSQHSRRLMTAFFYGVLVLGILPVLVGLALWAGDVWRYAQARGWARRTKVKGIDYWRVSAPFEDGAGDCYLLV